MMRTLLVFLFIAQSVSGQITIQDIQYSNNGASPFEWQTATLTGIVTASTEEGNLGFVFMQQDSVTEWGGIQLKGSIELLDLKLGDLVAATGTIVESGGMTTLDQITQVTVLDTGHTIEPVIVDPDDFLYYDVWETEKYECMLIQLTIPGDSVAVVRQNADTLGNNFGEYLIGSDTALPDTGCRVLAGRVTSTVLSSLNVSYVNDSIWANNSGLMNVPPIIVQPGDAFFGVRGIMTQSFGNMVLVPRNNDDFLPLSFGTGISDPKEELSISLFPNPVEDRLNLKIETPMDRSSLQVQIIGLDGKIHLSANQNILGNKILSLPVEGLRSGFYFVQLTSEKVSETRKFVKR